MTLVSTNIQTPLASPLPPRFHSPNQSLRVHLLGRGLLPHEPGKALVVPLEIHHDHHQHLHLRSRSLHARTWTVHLCRRHHCRLVSRRSHSVATVEYACRTDSPALDRSVNRSLAPATRCDRSFSERAQFLLSCVYMQYCGLDCEMGRIRPSHHASSGQRAKGEECFIRTVKTLHNYLISRQRGSCDQYTTDQGSSKTLIQTHLVYSKSSSLSPSEYMLSLFAGGVFGICSTSDLCAEGIDGFGSSFSSVAFWPGVVGGGEVDNKSTFFLGRMPSLAEISEILESSARSHALSSLGN